MASSNTCALSSTVAREETCPTPLPSLFLRAANVGFLLNATHGYIALSKNVFEGAWPAPCEPAKMVAAFSSCADEYWRDATAHGPLEGAAPAERVRFYANGIFSVTAERVLRHPLRFYEQLLERFAGRAPLHCVDGSSFLPFHERNTTGIVRAEVDCLTLEKLWHVLFGEHPMMPIPAKYDEMRFPESYLLSIAAVGNKHNVRPISGHQVCKAHCDWRGSCWSAARNQKLLEAGAIARQKFQQPML